MPRGATAFDLLTYLRREKGGIWLYAVRGFCVGKVLGALVGEVVRVFALAQAERPLLSLALVFLNGGCAGSCTLRKVHK